MKGTKLSARNLVNRWLSRRGFVRVLEVGLVIGFASVISNSALAHMIANYDKMQDPNSELSDTHIKRDFTNW